MGNTLTTKGMRPARDAHRRVAVLDSENGSNENSLVEDAVTERRKIKLPESLGFRDGTSSVHTSRTMMLGELSLVLEHVGAKAKSDEYRSAVVEQNVLGKPTQTTRKRTAERLVELYALDQTRPVFRLLRHFWSADASARPMLAYLAAAARDPVLRETTPFVVAIPHPFVRKLATAATSIVLDFDRNEHKSPEYRKLNPNARVPTLIVDGRAMYESAAIVLESPFQRAEVLAIVEAPEGNVYRWVSVEGGAAEMNRSLSDPPTALNTAMHRIPTSAAIKPYSRDAPPRSSLKNLIM